MAETEHRIYFSSDSCEQNSSFRFNVNLPYNLRLQGKWKCGILDFYMSSNRTPFVYILCDFCENSFIFTPSSHYLHQRPILKKVHINNSKYYEFPNPLYIPLKQTSIVDFDLWFFDSAWTLIKLSETESIQCTLHLIKDG